jgi:transposase-like protein
MSSTRRRYTAEEQQQFLEQVRSGASVREAAARLGFDTSIGYRWVQKAKAGASDTPKFARLIPASKAPAMVTIEVGTATLRVEAGFDAELLRSVISALSAAPK